MSSGSQTLLFMIHAPGGFQMADDILFQRDHSRGSGIGSEQNSEFLILDLKTGKAETFMENHPTDSDPSVSPDGKYIAFQSSERGGAADIYVLNLETGDLKQLTDIGDRSGWAYRTDWSPDGHQIAYELDVAPEGENIWLMNANGNRKRRFTPLPKGPNILFRGAPYWSPSGKYIMYYESRTIARFTAESAYHVPHFSEPADKASPRP